MEEISGSKKRTKCCTCYNMVSRFTMNFRPLLSVEKRLLTLLIYDARKARTRHDACCPVLNPFTVKGEFN